MKRTLRFEVTLDTESAYVVGLHVYEGAYGHTSVVEEGIDDPASIYDTCRFITEELTEKLD